MGEKASVKVPDGKLMKVEAEFDEVLDSISITGDFFIEPPEALEEMENALEGMSVTAPVEDMVGALENVDAEMIGFSPEHVVEAVREAIEGGE